MSFSKKADRQTDKQRSQTLKRPWKLFSPNNLVYYLSVTLKKLRSYFSVREAQYIFIEKKL